MEMEDGIVIKRLDELSQASEAEIIRMHAIWVIKNLLHKATVDEKEKIMHLFGWSNLKR